MQWNRTYLVAVPDSQAVWDHTRVGRRGVSSNYISLTNRLHRPKALHIAALLRYYIGGYLCMDAMEVVMSHGK